MYNYMSEWWRAVDGGVYLHVHSYRGIAALSGCDLVRRFSVVDGDAKGISLVTRQARIIIIGNVATRKHKPLCPLCSLLRVGSMCDVSAFIIIFL